MNQDVLYFFDKKPEALPLYEAFEHNLALIRKFSYNILRIAMLVEKCVEVMTEMMDEFCDDHALIEKYVFKGIKSFHLCGWIFI